MDNDHARDLIMALDDCCTQLVERNKLLDEQNELLRQLVEIAKYNPDYARAQHNKDISNKIKQARSTNR